MKFRGQSLASAIMADNKSQAYGDEAEEWVLSTVIEENMSDIIERNGEI